jgi:hypothetical protein
MQTAMAMGMEMKTKEEEITVLLNMSKLIDKFTQPITRL